MELELKHLSPYLPYGLKIHNKEWEHLQTLVGMRKPRDFCYLYLHGISNHQVETQSRHYSNDLTIKPVLRPLSDLTIQIEHNGKTFIPMRVILLIFGSYENIELVNEDDQYIILSGKGMIAEIHNIDNLPYKVASKLFEWHFDVFGLIPAGLAIDINTLDL